MIGIEHSLFSESVKLRDGGQLYGGGSPEGFSAAFCQRGGHLAVGHIEALLPDNGGQIDAGLLQQRVAAALQHLWKGARDVS